MNGLSQYASLSFEHDLLCGTAHDVCKVTLPLDCRPCTQPSSLVELTQVVNWSTLQLARSSRACP